MEQRWFLHSVQRKIDKRLPGTGGYISPRFSAVIICFLLIASLPLNAFAAEDRGGDDTGHRKECVILLHGLCRSSHSMNLIATDLQNHGYYVVNLDYASTAKSLESLAAQDLAPAVARCQKQEYERIHLVTHSMGALVVRTFLQYNRLPSGSRVVMLAPPNQGSELADWALRHAPRLYTLAGPSAQELGTEAVNGHHPVLMPLSIPVGVIAGNRSWNPLFSAILPGEDDGRVAVKRTGLPEMTDFITIPASHLTILFDRDARSLIIEFLQTCSFTPPSRFQPQGRPDYGNGFNNCAVRGMKRRFPFLPNKRF